MDKDTLNKRISAGNFVENNGSVLRAVNILKTKFNRLKDIKYALNIDKNDIENSVNYLHEAGYLHLRNSENRQPSSLADDDFETALAFGGMMFKPYLSHGKIYIDMIHADCFVPVAFVGK